MDKEIARIITRAEGMIEKLAVTCENNSNMYDKHLTSLEMARDKAQENSTALIERANQLMNLMHDLRNDYMTRIDELRKQNTTLLQQNDKLTNAIVRMTKGSQAANSEVSINMSK